MVIVQQRLQEAAAMNEKKIKLKNKVQIEKSQKAANILTVLLCPQIL